MGTRHPAAGPRWFRPLLFTLCCLPLARLLLGAFGLAGVSLGANPVEAIQDGLGEWALRLLLATLAISPLRRLTGRAWLLRGRRMLGLFAFTYAVLHLAVYAGLDLRFDWAHLGEDIAERPFITIGLATIVLLLPLALTSTDGWMRRLRRNWQRLHRLVYLAAVLAVWHYWWQVKRDALEPAVYAAVLAVLLGERVWRAWRRRAGRLNSASPGIDSGP